MYESQVDLQIYPAITELVMS